jgi:hypothetical protein
MAQQAINVNGTPQVFNSVLLAINGDTTGTEINGYIKSVSYTTGTLSEHVKTMNPDAKPITINSVCSEPSCEITFVAGAFATFYALLATSRFTKFSLSFIQYTTGDLAGPSQTMSINNAQLDQLSGTSSANSPENPLTIRFKATEIIPLPV